jgi:hypothetical protein
MFSLIKAWFRRNAYGVFTLRIIVALGSAAISIGISFLPYDAALQAIWVVISSLFMASLVLRQRLNESDDHRYRRLFNNRFSYLQANDPEALVTIFSENIRPRVLDWFQAECGVVARDVKTLDALDSLARSGDGPGQLIFRTGVQLGKWVQEVQHELDKVPGLETRLQQFVVRNEPLLGHRIASGIYLRHIRRGEQRPAGIHMFHPESRLLLTIEHYDEVQKRNAPALSARSHLFAGCDDSVWQTFVRQVYLEFPCFQAANGGSGPQKPSIPFFVGSIDEAPMASDEVLKAKLLKLAKFLPQLPKAEPPDNAGDLESSGVAKA